MHRWSARKLRAFWKLVQEEQIISVYVSSGGDEGVAAEDWRQRLEHAMDEAWASIADDDEAAAFNVARGHIEAAVSRIDGPPPGPAWAGFATAERLWFGDVLPVKVPDRLVWGRGPALSPMLRALEHERPAAAASTDQSPSIGHMEPSAALDRTVAARWRHGPRGAMRALELGQAAEVMISSAFLEREPDTADRLVGLALDAGATADLVGGPVGMRLDETAGGVAVRLRQVAHQTASASDPGRAGSSPSGS